MISRRLTTSPVSRIAGRRSRPERTGSRSSIRPGATGPESVIAAPRSRPIARIRSPYHGGTYSIVSSGACAIRARLIQGSNHARSTNFAPLHVGALRDRADEPLLARGPAQRDDLPRLEVGPEVDGELGEACESDIVHGTASVAGARMQPCRRAIATSWSPSTDPPRPSSRSPTPSRSPRPTGRVSRWSTVVPPPPLLVLAGAGRDEGRARVRAGGARAAAAGGRGQRARTTSR